MATRHHITVPFDRIVSELKLPARGVIPEATFTVRRPQNAPGWEEVGAPVPALEVRRARILYERGVIAAPAKPSEAAQGPEPKTKRRSSK